MKRILRHLLISLAVLGVVLTLALVFGGPGVPPPMRSVTNPFKDADFSGLPTLSRVAARDGTSLAYRDYPAAAGHTGCGGSGEAPG